MFYAGLDCVLVNVLARAGHVRDRIYTGLAFLQFARFVCMLVFLVLSFPTISSPLHHSYTM